MQNYVDNAGVVHEPHPSNTWTKDDHKINFKMEPGYQGSARDSPEERVEGFNVSKVDLALATVPGLDFDPTKRSFSAEELKPQPIIKKRKKVNKSIKPIFIKLFYSLIRYSLYIFLVTLLCNLHE